MSGSSMNQAKDALFEAIGRLKPSDRFNVIDFDSDFNPLFDSAMPAIKSNISFANRFIRGLNADGGTEMLEPITYAFKSRDSNSHNYLRQIVFITDGQSGNESAIFTRVQTRIEDDRFFTIGIALLQTPIYFLSLQTLEGAPLLILEAKTKLPKK
jgi:Ca-activated chloride channel family protein